jgi:O-acetyl-ADP-ribose deacetylase (regulator of RNase III)
VRRAFRSALERTREWQLAEVAIPPLGLGAGNLEIEVSAELMADELLLHRRTSAFPRRVTFVAETADEASALEHAVGRGAA